MKLHFYILCIGKGNQPIFNIEECEVVEKDGLFYPKENKLPYGAGRFVMPGDIGKLSISRLGLEVVMVILKEPNNAFAKQLISEYLKERIENSKEIVEKWKNKLRVVEEAKEGKQ